MCRGCCHPRIYEAPAHVGPHSIGAFDSYVIFEWEGRGGTCVAGHSLDTPLAVVGSFVFFSFFIDGYIHF